MSDLDGRWLALGVAGTLAAVGRLHRKGSAVRVGPRLRPRPLPYPLSKTDSLPTGLANLDEALGIAGWPRGRIVELYGPHQAMLETLAFQSITATQERAGTVAFIDAAHTFDTSYAKVLGVDLEHLLLAQPDSIEQAFEVISGLVKSGAVELVVATAMAVGFAKVADAQGMNARVWSQAMRELAASAERTSTTVLFVNPTKTKIDVTFGSSETTDTGNAMKYYASVRVDGRKLGPELVRLKVVKNKFSAPFRSADARFVPGKGLVPTDPVPADDDTGSPNRSGSRVRVGPRLRPSQPVTHPSAVLTAVPRRLTKADFRPRTRPGFYRRGHDIVRIDGVEFYSPVQDRPLRPSDWWIHGIGTLTKTERDDRRSKLTSKAGPSSRASATSTMWDLTHFTSSGYRKIEWDKLSDAWQAFFTRHPA